MIFSPKESRWQSWQWQIAQACRDMETLKTWIDLRSPGALIDADLQQAISAYQMGITPYYFSLIREFKASDPIFAQIIPTQQELIIASDEVDDPIGDEAPQRGSRPLEHLVHRYPDRVLLFPTALCAVYCRFCFRKRLVGDTAHNARETDLQAAYAYIREHSEIREVILTGGDPLTLGDDTLIQILGQLAEIAHIQTIRIHTRLPVVNPFRLTKELALRLRALPKVVWLVSHFNHPRELTEASLKHVSTWIDSGIPFLNQSVLLKGVNDHVETLSALLTTLIQHRIKPYYLHHPDRVKGTSHLRLTVNRGLELMEALRGRIPGYAIPHYVLDSPHGTGKISLQRPIDLYHPEAAPDTLTK